MYETTLNQLKLCKIKFFSLLLLISLVKFGISYCQSNEAVSDDFIRIASKITVNSHQIKLIWPGFWSDQEPFLFMKHDSIVHVYNINQKPEGDYQLIPNKKLPIPLKDRAFYKESYLPEYKDKKRSFPIQYKINNQMVYAMEPLGTDDFDRVNFYLHEAFHSYQRNQPGWKQTPGDTIAIKFNSSVLDSISQVDNARYKTVQNFERTLLLKLLDKNDDKNGIENILKKLVAVIQIRNTLIPAKAADLIDRYQRNEGSATYTGLLSSAVANRLTYESIYSKLKLELQKPLDEFSGFPVEEQRFLRWPQYAIGATYCILLDKLERKDWKKELEGGISLYELINSEVSLSNTELSRLKDEISNELGI